MLTPIARHAGALVMMAGLLGLVVYADQAHWARTEVLAATGSVANDCDRPAACRASQATFGRQEGGIDLGAMPTKSVCMLVDGVGEAAAAGDTMIAQAYWGVVIESPTGDMSAGRDNNSDLAASANAAVGQDGDL
jgi:hypothetical protein